MKRYIQLDVDFFFLQVTEKQRDSSNKLDLLKLSLELRAAELPAGSPERHAVESQINMFSQKQTFTTNEDPSANRYSTIAKPAELTGKDPYQAHPNSFIFYH